MAGIPPTGAPSEPTPPQEPTRSLAQNLKNATGEFVKQTYEFLHSPARVDNSETLNQYAQLITLLHELSNRAGGLKK